MADLRETILACLRQFLHDPVLLTEHLDGLAARHGPQVFVLVLDILADLQVSPSAALHHWKNILLHHRYMIRKLGRKVSLQTALIDYLDTRLGRPPTAKIVDIDAFERIMAQSRTDPLTGLYNRRVFDELFAREVSMALRHATELALLFFDLDDFKSINDRYSHRAGDEVLRQTARILQTERRSEDIVARYGGEEFLVLLPHTGKQEAMIIGERIRRNIAAHVVCFEHHRLRVTVSGGLAAYPFDGAGPETLLQDADQALYHAKRAGKNRICLYSDSMRRYVRAPLDTEVVVRDLRGGDGGDAASRPARCRNVSGGGLLIDCSRPFAIGDLVETRVPLTGDPPLSLAGRVVHNRNQGNDRWEIGIQLLDLDRRAAVAISTFVLGRSLSS